MGAKMGSLQSVAEGYDPTLGIMHESREESLAFVFDMMEPERPKVDRSILDFVKSHKFRAADFVIRSDGVCRLNPEMARCMAQVVVRSGGVIERLPRNMGGGLANIWLFERSVLSKKMPLS
jgi:CRISPR/Cas system-associated endonuclease Cas1